MQLVSGPPVLTSNYSPDDPTTPRAEQKRYHASSNSTISSTSTTNMRYAPTQPAIPAGQVLALAEEAMKVAREETQRSVAGGDAVVNGDLKPGVTIDLGHKSIAVIPDEMVDIIKDEIERLALSHNQISTFPDKFAECTRLRYLNVRSNIIREFPLAICQIPFLDILDISRNKLRVLPPEIANLTSLKVLSIQKNRIERLPQCLGDMNSLQVLKLDNNPIAFPPREILEAKDLDLPSSTNANERDALFTAHIKRYLKQHSERPETESGGESSSDGAADTTDTVRPIKRVASGRFPIKVSTGNESTSDARSPALPRPPPLPQRSHARILSQQTAALRRPGVTPLPIANERLRSNSESILQATRANRQKRMGMVTRKTSDLGTVDEGRLARHSHYRGHSHGSLMQGNSRNGTGSGGNSSSSPVSPTEAERHKGNYVRRLSSLPEHKRESHSPDPIVEGAKGILYALFQVHPHISNLISVVRDASSKRTSLERVFYNAATHVEELDRELHKFDTYAEEDEDMLNRSNDGVKRACTTCVMAYQHVGTLLQRNVRKIIQHGDQRYVRTLLLLVYGSLLEIRNACFSLAMSYRGKRPSVTSLTSTAKDADGTIRARVAHSRPTLAQAGRMRSVTEGTNGSVANANNVLSVPLNPSSTVGTPRSGETFPTASIQPLSRNNTMHGADDPEEERLFEKIFLSLKSATDKAVTTLPTINEFFVEMVKKNRTSEGKAELDLLWSSLNQLCLISMEKGRDLKARLSTIKLKEPGIRGQRALWELCNAFIKSFVDLALRVKDARKAQLITNDILLLLRQVQRLVKDCGILIETSPWKELAASQHQHQQSQQQPQPITHAMIQAGLNSNTFTSSANTGVTSPASPYVTPLPATPLSAALGPAVQATVPSTPMTQNNYGMFNGNAFDRADSLLSLPSRSLTSGITDGYAQNVGLGMPSSLLSPMGVRKESLKSAWAT